MLQAPSPSKAVATNFFQNSHPTYLHYYRDFTKDLDELNLKQQQKTLQAQHLVPFLAKYGKAQAQFATPGTVLFILALYECGNFYFILGEYPRAFQFYHASKTALTELSLSSMEELKKIDEQFKHQSSGMFCSFVAAYSPIFMAFNPEYESTQDKISATLIETWLLSVIEKKIKLTEELTLATMKATV